MNPAITTPFAYLASPFTRYPDGHDAAVVDISVIAAQLIRSGVKLYCPIAHSAPLMQWGGLDPIDEALWRDINQPFLHACEILIVACLDGWEESAGIQHEIAHFALCKKPIFYLDAATLTMKREQVAA